MDGNTKVKIIVKGYKGKKETIKMEWATIKDANEILQLYTRVVEHVNTTDIKLGWNVDVYPNDEFIKTAISNKQMCIIRVDNVIAAAAVVNHNVNDEYNDIDWVVKAPASKIATIHALAVSPGLRGTKTSYTMLSDIEAYCKQNGDLAIHLDVIDTNIPAYKLYIRNGYTEVACIKMFYEVVGTREFWMMEHVL